MSNTSPEPSGFTRERGEPLLCYQRWREAIEGNEALLLVDFRFQPYWLDGDEPVALTAIYYAHGITLNIAVTDQVLAGRGYRRASSTCAGSRCIGW